MKVIIAGSQKFRAYNRIKEVIAASEFPITEVVSGCADGVDLLGELWAKNNNLPIQYFSTRWGDCKGDGNPKRNAKMVAVAEGLIAVYNSIESNGTADLIKQVKAAGLPYYIYDLSSGRIEKSG